MICRRGSEVNAFVMSRWIIVWFGCSANLCCMTLQIESEPFGRPMPYWCSPAAVLISCLQVRCIAVAVMRRMAVPTARGPGSDASVGLKLCAKLSCEHRVEGGCRYVSVLESCDHDA